MDVNKGCLDALILSEKLTHESYESLEAAIKSYEEEMLIYAREAQMASERNEIDMRKSDFSFQQLIR
ncbi:MAG TPA: hypothetical protein DEB71_05460 [Chryseobacterium carnipullorum]|nr:hypothetical protein [Chryseobacterium carnipullorum]